MKVKVLNVPDVEVKIRMTRFEYDMLVQVLRHASNSDVFSYAVNETCAELARGLEPGR